MMRPLQARVMGMLARAVITAVNDAASAQALQIETLADDAADEVERFAQYGFTSVPHPGAEAIVAAMGGLRSHGVVIAVEDRRYRLKGLKSGEVALFDDQDQVVKLGREGVEITTPRRMRIEAETIELGGEGGRKVARVGDQVDLTTGKIVEGSDVVSAT